ncbi:MAG: hypothetical protein IPN86_04590 [Saprospiraceae bacterium]|nr:hypothetical protein [Saprospiraceae bacterium]
MKTLDEIWTDLGGKILESTIGNVPTNHRLKKTSNQIWEIEVSTTSDLINGFTVRRFHTIYKRNYCI